MASAYERELKGILMGDEKILARCVRTCTPVERENYYSILSRPFIVIRAAGSFGMDLVAIRGDFSFPIEEKSSVNPVLHFSDKPRLKEQADHMMVDCQRAGVVPVYAFRLKNTRGDAWRVFTLDIEGLEGRNRLLHSRIPTVASTKKGNLVLRWEEGMPLNLFISYLCSHDE